MKPTLLALALSTVIIAKAQDVNVATYHSSLGVKISSGVAASYKTFISNKNALEFQTTFFRQGLRMVGLYEFHKPFNNVDGLSWYFGPGAHVGIWKKNYRDKYNSTVDVGIDGVLGIDYKVPSLPINLSLDWQPSLSLLGNAALSPQFGGIAIRYILD